MNGDEAQQPHVERWSVSRPTRAPSPDPGRRGSRWSGPRPRGGGIPRSGTASAWRPAVSRFARIGGSGSRLEVPRRAPVHPSRYFTPRLRTLLRVSETHALSPVSRTSDELGSSCGRSSSPEGRRATGARSPMTGRPPGSARWGCSPEQGRRPSGQERRRRILESGRSQWSPWLAVRSREALLPARKASDGDPPLAIRTPSGVTVSGSQSSA